MASNLRFPAKITNDEIRARIRELNTGTEDDDPFLPWDSVEALEAELEARGEPVPGIWDEPEVEDLADQDENLDRPWLSAGSDYTLADMYPNEYADIMS